MAVLEVGQMVSVSAMHKSDRPGVVLWILDEYAIVIIAGSTKDLNPRREVIRAGSFPAKAMGLKYTTYFCEDGVVVLPLSEIRPRRERCPERIRRLLELAGRRRAQEIVGTSGRTLPDAAPALLPNH